MRTQNPAVVLVEDALEQGEAYERLGVGRRMLLHMVAPGFVGKAKRTGRDAAAAFAVPEQKREFNAFSGRDWLDLGR